jgi:hypothetical protein
MAEEQTPTPDQLNELQFIQLVLMFQGAAYQHMGKVMNPVTNKVERDLAQAKNAIDILGMLEAKTKGNLTDNEARLLEHSLYELRMNYVDEMNKGEPESEGADEGAEKEAASDEEGSETASEETEDEGSTEADTEPSKGEAG